MLGRSVTVEAAVSHGLLPPSVKVSARSKRGRDEADAGNKKGLFSGLKRFVARRSHGGRHNNALVDAWKAGTAKQCTPCDPFKSKHLVYVYYHDTQTASSRTKHASKRSTIALAPDGSLKVITDQTFDISDTKRGWSTITDKGLYWVQPARTGFHILCSLNHSTHVMKFDNGDTERGSRDLDNFTFDCRVAKDGATATVNESGGVLRTLKRDKAAEAKALRARSSTSSTSSTSSSSSTTHGSSSSNSGGGGAGGGAGAGATASAPRASSSTAKAGNGRRTTAGAAASSATSSSTSSARPRKQQRR